MRDICHLFDRTIGWEQRLGAGVLLDRLPVDGYATTLATIDHRAVRTLKALGCPVESIGHGSTFRSVAPLLAAPALRRLLEARRCEIVHAWGVPAGLAAWIARGRRGAAKSPLVVELFDPVLTRSDVKILRTMVGSGGAAVACSCRIVQRRLIEGGVSPQACVVIRPGVDFGLINRCRRGRLREELGVARGDLLVILPESQGCCHGHVDAFSAAVLVDHLRAGVRVLLPGRSRENGRIARLADTLPNPSALLLPGDRYAFEELLAISDVLVVPAQGDISTTCIAWAMAAGVAVIGTAVHSVAELIAAKVNGLLFKRERGRNMIVSLAKLLLDRQTQDKMKEVARGQAYEIFGVRRYVEQHIRLYDNLMSGGAPGEGIVDSATVG